MTGTEQQHNAHHSQGACLLQCARSDAGERVEIQVAVIVIKQSQCHDLGKNDTRGKNKMSTPNWVNGNITIIGIKWDHEVSLMGQR